MEGMRNCIEALVKKDKKDDKNMLRFKNEVHDMFLNWEPEPTESTESTDSTTETTETPFSCPEESPLMNGVPEFLKTPKARPEGGDSIMWIASDYHYYMNCVDEVEMRVLNDFQNRNETQWGPAIPVDIPPNDYYLYDLRDGMPLDAIVNEGFVEVIAQVEHPWAWMDIDLFYFINGAHDREMLSWKSDEAKEFLKLKRTWYKEEVANDRNYMESYLKNFVYRYCSGLPTFKRIWGTPIREDGCNPKYPYTSWVNEGFDSKAADCDAEFNHIIPKGFTPGKIKLDGGNCFDCGGSCFNCE